MYVLIRSAGSTCFIDPMELMLNADAQGTE